MKKLLINLSVVALCSLFFAACDEYVAYEKTYDLEHDMMLATNPLVYEFENGTDTFQLYDVSLQFTLTPDFALAQIPIELGYGSSKGKMAIPMAIPVYDKNKNFLGEVREDESIVLKQTILYENRMAEGKNIFTITPGTYNDTIQGLSSVMVKIEKAN